jgi:hypothetical protein
LTHAECKKPPRVNLDSVPLCSKSDSLIVAPCV